VIEMGKLPISATIVARNEEQKIARCLKSLTKLVDEIIFIHDGRCADSTLKIVRKYTKRISVRPYVGEAEPHRKFAISQANHSWILQIDADEYLTLGLAEALPKLIKDQEISGYRFRWNVSYQGEKPRYNQKLSLYKKDRIKQFYGIPHEVVTLTGRILSLEDIELGHDRTKSRIKTLHDTREWPKIHGKYLEEYKFRNLPDFILPIGYVFYPLLSTGLSIIKQTISPKEAFGCFDYHFRLWHSFCLHRYKRKGGR
jgi:glycosyltransferase involved in cell wall biosynthesis